MKKHRLLTADIGGTNSRFAMFEAGRDGTLTLGSSIWLETRAHKGFAALLEALSDKGMRPSDADACVFAVAGPVSADAKRSAPPLIGWDIDLHRATGLPPAALINDFVAQAYACVSPIGHSAEITHPGIAQQGFAKAVIGAGTGFGKAIIVPEGARFRAMPSEGGHASFPFQGDDEARYESFLLKETGHLYMNINTVVSGRGLSLLHKFLTGQTVADRDLVPILSPGSVTPGSQTQEGALTLEWGARFYGRVARNFALDTYALGGLFIAGGVAARTPALLTHKAFIEEFESSAAHAELLKQIPVYLLSNEESGLWGAAYKGLQMLEEM